MGEPEWRRAGFRLRGTNCSELVVGRWAVSFALPAGAHAYGDGTGFGIAPEVSAAGGRRALFEVECLRDVYVCGATWDLMPGARAAVRVTVHGPDCRGGSAGPHRLSILS
ncbi:hypothetical protein ABZ490_49970 [Streptomyces sp. NPDC005811]|uniref:hypothetical protein n=1 Tax=Streptomyces sp. NPDC005811 TaxID=3154565 RepID=UPI0033E79A0A